jgi:membrane-associated phospholipid phosphatase
MAAKTDTTPYKGHFKLYLTGLILSLLVFAVGAFWANSGKPMDWEENLFLSVNGWPEALYKPMMILAFMGGGWFAATAVATAFATQFYRLAARLAISILAGYGLTAICKHLIDRARPDAIVGDAISRATEAGMGYPSTHAAIITIILLTLLPYLKWRWRWIVPVGIAAVCLSRLYLGPHLPLDVVGGVALGTAIVAFVRVLPQPLRVALRID